MTLNVCNCNNLLFSIIMSCYGNVKRFEPECVVNVSYFKFIFLKMSYFYKPVVKNNGDVHLESTCLVSMVLTELMCGDDQTLR